MNWIKEYILQKFLLDFVKSKLDKLPGNGWKTVLGIVELVLGLLLVQLPEFRGPLQFLIDLLNQLGPDPITDMGIVALVKGIVTTLVGIIHKILKKEEAKQLAKADPESLGV